MGESDESPPTKSSSRRSADRIKAAGFTMDASKGSHPPIVSEAEFHGVKASLHDAYLEIVKASSNFSQDGATAFGAFKRSVKQANDLGSEVCDEILSDIDDKRCVIEFLCRMAKEKASFRKQVKNTVETMLQVDSWKAAWEECDALTSELPESAKPDVKKVKPSHFLRPQAATSPQAAEKEKLAVPAGLAGPAAGPGATFVPYQGSVFVGAPQSHPPPPMHTMKPADLKLQGVPEDSRGSTCGSSDAAGSEKVQANASESGSTPARQSDPVLYQGLPVESFPIFPSSDPANNQTPESRPNPSSADDAPVVLRNRDRMKSFLRRLLPCVMTAEG
jgi:hypothetical protein